MLRTEHSRTRLFWRNIQLFMLFWTLVIVASLIWNLYSQRQGIKASLYSQAAAVHGIEMEYRNWVIQNGGIYVPASDKIRPNPWLKHVPERDIKTPSDRLLTLLNSSYVVRLVHENMRVSGSALRDHIASLKPINPANAADPWERRALESFARGAKESASFDVLPDGKTYYRYMKPMVTEEPCLKCHERFGDKLGDIRGGVSVAIPVDVVMLAGRNERNAMIAGHGLIWGLGLIGLFVGGRKQQQAMQAVEKGEETLRTNEERLHLATTAGNIGIWDWDVVRNELAWDESMYALYGIRAEDFGGAYDAWIRTLHPDDRQFTDGEIQAALRGEREYAPEFRIVRPDGAVRNIKAASKTYYDTQGKPIRMVGTNIDITDRKKAEEAARSASQYARSLIEASLDPLVTISAEGKITDVNRATEEVTGRSRGELIGTDFSDYFTDPDKARKGYQQVFAQGSVTDYPLALRHRDGHVTDVLYNASVYRDGAGKELGVFAAARDVTERKLAEEKLRRSEHSLAEAQRIAHLGNWDLDLVNNVLTWSDEIFRIFEIDPEKFGASYEAFLNAIHPDDRDMVNKAYTDSVANKVPYDIVHRLRMDDGRIKYVNEMCETYYAGDGKPLRSVGTVHDITERKLAEDEVKALNRNLEQRVIERTAQLEAANKELEAFSYSVSHDLRTPLRAIDGFSGILLEDYKDKLDEEGKRLLNVVRDNTNRMGQLIDDILKFSRTGRLEITLAEIDMEKMVHEVFEELRPAVAGRKLQLEIEHLPPARGDNAMMHQVFVNLLSNAIKFSRHREPAMIKVGGSIAGEEAVYYVKDNGAGFDMQFAGKLFGVFQRLHGMTEFEGTGIGLAIVKRIITRHGGRVWAEGKPNEGATIYFALPTKEAAHG